MRTLLEDRATEPVFSAVSLWEVAIKNGLGRPDFRVDPRLLRRGLLEHGHTELAITGAHAVAVDLLPPLHGDPFDRVAETDRPTAAELRLRNPDEVRTLLEQVCLTRGGG